MTIQDFTTEELISEIERRKTERRHTIYRTRDRQYYAEAVVTNVNTQSSRYTDWSYHLRLNDDTIKRLGADCESIADRSGVHVQLGCFTKKTMPKIGDVVRLYAKMTEYEYDRCLYAWTLHRAKITDIIKRADK